MHWDSVMEMHSEHGDVHRSVVGEQHGVCALNKELSV